MPKITWSATPRARGLAGIGEGPRGFTVKIDGEWAGSVGLAYTWPERRARGWYSAVTVGGVRRNTSDQDPPVFFPDKDSAKADCDRWMRAQLGLPPKRGA